MTCEEIDDLRTEGRPTDAGLAQSAREHLQSCERCREFQALWDSPMPTVEIPLEVQARITRHIVSGLQPVSPLPSNLVLIARLLLLAGIATTTGAWWLGQAGWYALAPWQSVTVFSLLSGSTLLMAQVVTQQMVPGARQRIAPSVAITVVFVSLLVAILLLFPYKRDPDFVRTGLGCWERGLAAGTGAALLFFPMLRRGAWLSPLKLGAATGCLAGLSGLTVLEIYCPYLDRGHIGFWHLGAALTATLIGVAIGAIGLMLRDCKHLKSF